MPNRTRIVDHERARVLEYPDHIEEAGQISVETFHLVDPDQIHVLERQRFDEPFVVVVKHAVKLSPVEVIPVDEKYVMPKRFKTSGAIQAVMLIDFVGDP